jgi:hypothetical protein
LLSGLARKAKAIDSLVKEQNELEITSTVGTKLIIRGVEGMQNKNSKLGLGGHSFIEKLGNDSLASFDELYLSTENSPT